MRYNRLLFGFDSAAARQRLATTSVLLDHYNGRLINRNDDFDAEHIYALKNAWVDGFRDQYLANPLTTKRAMKAFANDPRNLIPVSPSSNRSRGSKGLWGYVPLNLASIPMLNQVKYDLAKEFGLTISKDNLYAMAFAEKVLKKHSKGISMRRVRKWLFQLSING